MANYEMHWQFAGEEKTYSDVEVVFGKYSGETMMFFDCHNVMDCPIIAKTVQLWLKASQFTTQIIPVMLSFVGIENTDLQNQVLKTAGKCGMLCVIVYKKHHKALIMGKARTAGVSVLGLVDDQLANLDPVWKMKINVVLCTISAPQKTKHSDEKVAMQYLHDDTMGFFLARNIPELETCLDYLVENA
jgi:hypothetical protein